MRERAKSDPNPKIITAIQIKRNTTNFNFLKKLRKQHLLRKENTQKEIIPSNPITLKIINSIAYPNR